MADAQGGPKLSAEEEEHFEHMAKDRFTRFTKVNLNNVDPGLINPCLLIWGCSPPRVINPH